MTSDTADDLMPGEYGSASPELGFRVFALRPRNQVLVRFAPHDGPVDKSRIARVQ